jgi:hypothetical protein
VNPDLFRKLGLSEPGLHHQVVDRTVRDVPLRALHGQRSITFHPATVDPKATSCKREFTTDSPCAVKVSKRMGDSRHKKPPPDAPEEDVTDEFRREVLEALDLNAQVNRLRRRRKGDPGYLISNRAELADAIPGMHKTMVNKILGGARDTTKVKLVERSAYVSKIREVLQLAPTDRITIPARRGDVMRWIAALSDEAFAVFEEEFKRELRKTSGR